MRHKNINRFKFKNKLKFTPKLFFRCYFFFILCSCIFLVLYLANNGDFFISPRQTIASITKETDEEWLPVLANGKIAKSWNFIPGNAYAEKYKIKFEDGKEAVAKVLAHWSQPLLPFFFSNERTEFDHKEFEDTRRALKGRYQGWPELLAFHVDRLLQLYKKAPTVGRMVSNKELYTPLDISNGWTFPRILYAFMMYWMPEFYVPVTITGWVSNIKNKWPNGNDKFYLVLPDEYHIPPFRKEYIGEISDTLVFDYLIDDHDRSYKKNWLMLNDHILTLDSGLGWNHGPYSDCLPTLCGLKSWRDSDSCNPICVFRKKTIELLESMGPDAPPERKLGYLLKKSLEKDIIGNDLFKYAVFFKDNTTSSYTRFQDQDFFDGIDFRVTLLLDHVDTCIHFLNRKVVLDSV